MPKRHNPPPIIAELYVSR